MSQQNLQDMGHYQLDRDTEMPLNGKDRKIDELKRQLQKTLVERNDFKAKLKTKDDEVRELELQKTKQLSNEMSKKQSERIAILKRQLQNTEVERNDVKAKLKTKGDEVRELELQKTLSKETSKKKSERIAMLENDRTTLQVRLRTVEAKIIRQENEIKDLVRENEDRKEEIRRLNEKLQKIDNKNEELGEEVKGLKNAVAPNDSEQTLALLYLGELCCQIQSSMYEKILPDHFNSWENYKVKTIDRDIKDPSVVNTESERVETAKNFQELKTNLNWNKGLEDAVKSLQNSRNCRAHPKDLIDEASLRKYAKALHDQGQLKGRPSLEQVNELIDIWLRLQ